MFKMQVCMYIFNNFSLLSHVLNEPVTGFDTLGKSDSVYGAFT